MIDYITIGSSPCEEDCVQVSSNPMYYLQMRDECRRFIGLIREQLGLEPEGARLKIERFEHDFGPYLEVICCFNDNYPEAIDYAFRCENEAPKKWE